MAYSGEENLATWVAGLKTLPTMVPLPGWGNPGNTGVCSYE
jgi:hypothetical protein